ncbi:MAG: DUF368 domain-containing protein [Oscillospiraceae bacterium]|nr:DUF368 domain-containing protein [Oscillospiraceae bacterium]
MGWTIWLRQALAGFILGIACVLPGISGGVLAMSMELYQPILSALSNFGKDVRGNARFLAPLAIGGGVGILLTARALSALVARAETEITVLFIGLVLGGLPGLWKQAAKASRGGAARAWAGRALLFAAGFAFTFAFGLLETVFKVEGATRAFDGVLAIISGGVYAFATVIPGISSSFLLLFLGVYQPMMDAIANLRIRPLLFALSGGIVVAAVLVKAAEWLFRRFSNQCTFVVMGFVLGSVWLVFSWEVFVARWLMHIMLLACGATLAILISRSFSEKHQT